MAYEPWKPGAAMPPWIIIAGTMPPHSQMPEYLREYPITWQTPRRATPESE